MPLHHYTGATGPYSVRPPFRAEDYTADKNSLRALGNWRGSRLDLDQLLDEHGGPFESYRLVERFERGGKRWARFQHLSGEFCVDVEILQEGLGEIVPVDPKTAYDIARAADAGRSPRVVEQ